MNNDAKLREGRGNVMTKEVSAHKGAILKQTREEKGLSLETVHEATKIPLDALRAIEEDYTIKILSPFYYRSFIKIYAGYLDIDVAQVIDDYKKENLPRHIEKEPSMDFDILDRFNRFLTKQRKQQIFYVTVAFLSLFFMSKFVAFLMTHKPAPKPKIKVERQSQEIPLIAEPQRSIEEKPRASVVETATEVQEVSQEPTSTVPAKKVVLTVRAKKNSWLRVKSDGNIVFQSTLNTGSVETYSADEKIEITGRNISDLEFELNGKLIGSLGKASRQAKGLIATSEGLSVTK